MSGPVRHHIAPHVRVCLADHHLLREKLLNDVFFKKIPAVVVSRGLPVDDLLLRIADRHRVPLIRTQLKSKDFSAEATVLRP